MADTPISKAEAWARREMQNAETQADRDFMAMVTHRTVSAFMPERTIDTEASKAEVLRLAYRSGQMSEAQWQAHIADGDVPEPEAEKAAAPAAASFQDRVKPWMLACFGEAISSDRLERGDRLLEEVLELLQSGEYPPERVAALTNYVFGRPKGEPFQETGGVMVTLAAYCLAHGLDMHVAGEIELERIWSKVEAIRAKQAAKPVGSALPAAVSASDPVLQAYRLGQERMRNRAARTNIDRTGREWVRDSLWDRIAADLSAKIERLAIEEWAP